MLLPSFQIPKTHLRSLLDRIDIHIEIPRVDYEKLSEGRLGETSESIRSRVHVAIEVNQISVKIEAGVYTQRSYSCKNFNL